MNIRQYLIETKSPLAMSRFADFSLQLKNEFKTLDGYAFNFNKSEVCSIKLYHKIYTRNTDFDNNFFRWFFEHDLFYYFFLAYFNPASLECNHKGLSGINCAIKYDLINKKLTRSIYTQATKRSCFVIHSDGVNIWTTNYYYIYNKYLIKLINKLFKLNMPDHNEAIEFSARENRIHATIFPKIKGASSTLDDSKTYCARLMPSLISDNSLPCQNIPLSIYCHDRNSSFITKGYTSDNQMQKIYFGCFDWKKSIFQN